MGTYGFHSFPLTKQSLLDWNTIQVLGGALFDWKKEGVTLVQNGKVCFVVDSFQFVRRIVGSPLVCKVITTRPTIVITLQRAVWNT